MEKVYHILTMTASNQKKKKEWNNAYMPSHTLPSQVQTSPLWKAYYPENEKNYCKKISTNNIIIICSILPTVYKIGKTVINPDKMTFYIASK